MEVIYLQSYSGYTGHIPRVAAVVSVGFPRTPSSVVGFWAFLGLPLLPPLLHRNSAGVQRSVLVKIQFCLTWLSSCKKHSFARCFKTCIFLLTELLCLFLVIIFFPSSFYCSHLVLSKHLFFHLGFLVLLSISYPSSWWSFIDLLSLNITFFTFPFDVAFFALISQCVLYAKREGGSSVCAEIWLLVLPLNSATPATAL